MPKFTDLPLRTKLFASFLVMAFITALAGGLGGYFLQQVGNRGETTAIKTSPLVSAILSLRLETAIAHQLLEEVLSGDALEDIQEVWHHLDRAHWYGNAILNGGAEGKNSIHPTDDPKVREIIRQVLVDVTAFRKMARIRYELSRKGQVAGGPADQLFDQQYHALLDLLAALRDKMRESGQEAAAAAIGEIRFQLSSAHLMLEELITGDDDVTIDNVRLATNLAREGMRSLATPLGDEGVRTLISDMEGFKSLSEKRYADHQRHMEDLQQSESEFDKAFNAFSADALGAEALIQETIREDVSAFLAESDAAVQEMIAVAVASLLVGLLLAWLLSRNIIHAVSSLSMVMEQVRRNDDYSLRATISGNDEVSRLGQAFNYMLATVESQYWLQSNVAGFTEIIQKAATPRTFAQSLVSRLSPLLEAGHGALYVLDPGSDRYALMGSYAFRERKGLQVSFAEGEGLVGQCVLERQTILLTQVPHDYVRIGSGLGEGRPLQIIAVPIVFQDRVLAVLELASFVPLTPIRIRLLEELAPSIGLGLENLYRTLRTQELLEETQRQAEELEAQQEELRQTNEELQKQTESLRASEEELRAQQEELEESNDSLREKSRILERSQQELESSRKEIEGKARDLELASRYKSEFLANMSHELRTPLNSLLILARGFSENEEGNLTRDQVEAARTIHDSGTDLLNLINDILDLSKVESGRVELVVEEFPLSDLAEGIRRQFTHMANEKGLSFQVEISNDAPPKLDSDSGKVMQILKNLISNAIKFTPKGQVTITLTAPEPFTPAANRIRMPSPDDAPPMAVAIHVADSGIGIPEDKLLKTFEAFQQVDGSISRQYGGTGLGLSISRELAALLKGEIRVESRLGEGTVFSLLLPLRIAMPEQTCRLTSTLPMARYPSLLSARFAARRVDRATIPGDDRKKIGKQDKVVLVIEDDGHFAEIIMNLGRQRGFKCLWAAEGDKGLKLAEEYHPVGIVLDLLLPGLDGWSVLDRLKENPKTKDIPVHIVSAVDKDSEGFRRGAIGYLTKPVTREQLDRICSRFEQFHGEGTHTLLLVEDDPVIRDETRRMVESKQIEVVSAGSGEEAWEQLTTRHFDCMILDLGLPDISGFELLKRGGEDGTVTIPPVIIYSGRELTRDEQEQLRSHTDSIVIKGLQSSERLLDEVALFLHHVAKVLPEGEGPSPVTRDVHDQQALFEGRKVLLVDDDMRNTFALSRALKMKGLSVFMAPNGRRALGLLEENQGIEIVLMDIMMPEMDGYEAITEIRKQERFKDLPIIALSAKAMVGDQEKAMAVGANDYLPKPVDVDRLLTLLRIWLSGK